MTSIKLEKLNPKLFVILFFTSVLGLSSSCEKDNPKGYFIISGMVGSKADHKPIRDIIVEVRDTKLIETSYTDYEGDYMAEVYDFPGDRTFNVRFSDTDGAINGEYESFDTTVVFKDPVFIGGDGEDYAGYCDLFLNVELKPKK